MDNRYHDIAERIDGQAGAFGLYLQEFVLGGEAWGVLRKIAAQSDVYIFSGVIRNFLLGYLDNRDLDIVIRNIEDLTLPKRLLSLLSIRRNSFGGFKLRMNHLTIDAWGLENTWGIVKEGKVVSPDSLIDTAFFNFSAIVYDVGDSCFIYKDDFCRFMRTHVLDVVYPENPNVTLCIVNTLYYLRKYQLDLSLKLCHWIVGHYQKRLDFDSVQLRHFGTIEFSEKEIASFVSFCRRACAC